MIARFARFDSCEVGLNWGVELTGMLRGGYSGTSDTLASGEGPGTLGGPGGACERRKEMTKKEQKRKMKKKADKISITK